MDLNQMTLF